MGLVLTFLEHLGSRLVFSVARVDLSGAIGFSLVFSVARVDLSRALGFTSGI